MIETKQVPEYTIGLRKRLYDALQLDGGPLGDVTSLALIENECQATAEFIVKADEGIVSGLEVARIVFEIVNPEIKFTPLLRDGDPVKQGDIFATVQGPARSILAGERIALEFLRRMSGIATRTMKFVAEAAGTGATILDTRKILPGYGELDKQAVRDGGGTNHRANLSEMGLIKNNHIDILNGDVAQAIQIFREKYPRIPLEVEVRNRAELISALINTPDRILLDNMNNDKTGEAVRVRDEYIKHTGVKIPLEASGNMTLERIKEVAQTGVEYISVGSLTHSVEAFDISLHVSFNK
ncbi:TPA: carboxylating nicotinate-nucleotide diphosphorylase [Candidatus Collierbacteria bacterium]|uniref:Probable nicotinate-nucleotide pyrophosphorylase [carboxylating] n=1 Tax=Candidatus Collierbacteria bacterium GW2011_GWB2_44_22 TaxID=1618387 RepID=A0A0G1HYN0_9BACT|nr:MAG: Nicotinate-nucleotide pyrophosphorylase (Carboxylating) [Candidatus Collierbacteria bacterium GW2011_GWA2_44_13]KKT51668.1 MAG: Nicotinate-nucleotide pyrophosphorylase (Carboxylating) [Candidatus Collierbacteria bacterium GW2011_GWB2_44_22]KKT62596.1 MAG: Nicotinate-nucleotide pyrophosphorylase (Carboxylating) [Candidatus Collierbacteria bacterium GW2011_GWD1_44_27]KKT66028.1 MAG: Nicotinate-nucleotide pyrophosphorylase (Carboxylating) [Candidatus Collierbacteria bacterium GW2011_GWC2_44